jgi:pantothenate kinase type III
MLLVIDVSNTNTSLGVYREDVLLAHWRLTTNQSGLSMNMAFSRNLFALAPVQGHRSHRCGFVVPPLNYT